MIENISSLLFYPFTKGSLPYPKEKSSSLFWNAQYFTELADIKNFDYIQTFKPYANIAELYNIEVKTKLPSGKEYDYIFCALPKQKDAARFMIAQSFHHLKEDGLLIAIAANDAGGKNIEKQMKEIGATPSSLSKNKCRIVWACNNKIDSKNLNLSIQNGQQTTLKIANHSITTQPGIFGWNKIDKGSKLLSENLPDTLTGTGADFGCGYGYLSLEILKNNPDINKLYALEADHNALACAQKNLKMHSNVEYNWTDLTVTQNKLTALDWIIMNPPFHEGKKTQNSIGQNFISTAANFLKKKGVLYMVANIHLPYEKHLQSLFSTVDKIYEEQGYKIFKAQK